MKRTLTAVSARALMLADWAAYLLKISAKPGARCTKDGEPTADDIKKAQDAFLKTFEDFKKENDERLAALEKGKADVLTDEKVDRVNEEVGKLKDIADELEKIKMKLARPGVGGTKDADAETPEQEDHAKAFKEFLRAPEDHEKAVALSAAEKAARLANPEWAKAVDTQTGAAGGHAVPEVISRKVERELKEISTVRNLVDVQQAGSKDFKLLVDVNGAAYGWVGETDARPETGTSGLEEVAPTFGTIYAYPKAAEEALDDIFFNVERWIVDDIVEGFAEGEENATFVGNGTKKPTGILSGTPSADVDGARAFGVLQYYPSGNATGFAASNPLDRFLNVVYGLKKGYRRNARWCMNKLTVAAIRKFKDGQGNYLWQPSATAGQPATLLEYPVAESEEMPDIAGDAFPVAFGDFKAGYVLCDLVGFRLTKDDNITEPGYVKWYARRRLGGKVKKSEAIKLIKIATS